MMLLDAKDRRNYPRYLEAESMGTLKDLPSAPATGWRASFLHGCRWVEDEVGRRLVRTSIPAGGSSLMPTSKPSMGRRYCIYMSWVLASVKKCQLS
jgi:hypothetical protein